MVGAITVDMDGCGDRHVDESSCRDPLRQPLTCEETPPDALTLWEQIVDSVWVPQSRMKRKLALFNTINFLEDFFFFSSVFFFITAVLFSPLLGERRERFVDVPAFTHQST